MFEADCELLERLKTQACVGTQFTDKGILQGGYCFISNAFYSGLGLKMFGKILLLFVF